MMPMEFADKTAACRCVPQPFWHRVRHRCRTPTAAGLGDRAVFGLLPQPARRASSPRPDAPIIILGVAGGAIIGFIVDRWGK